MNTYDLIIIGGGPAGYLAAERASEGGLKTLLFEKRNLGGVCLNEGCIPTKSLLNSAKIYTKADHGEIYGVVADGLQLRHEKVIARKNKVVKILVSGVKTKMKQGGVEVVRGDAAIKGRSDAGFLVTAEGADYCGRQLLIAAGSRPILPPISGLEDGIKSGFIVTSREILDIETVPEKLAIVGGGVIGLEMADYFNTAGAEVTVVEMMDKIAGPFDEEISGMLEENLSKRGIVFHLGSRVTGFSGGSLQFEKGGRQEDLKADKILLSIGRRPSTNGLGLETLGIFTEKGAIQTDKTMQTNIPGVYAAGDVNGVSMLAHTAYREAEVAVSNILGSKDVMRYDVIPAVIYTTPETASVGETEETAREKGYRFAVKKLPMAFVGRFVAENERPDGVCKALVEEGTDRLLGVQIIGSYASEIILSAGVMIESGLPLASLKKIVFAHPTVGEIIREVMFS